MKCIECNRQKVFDSHKEEAMLIKTILNTIEKFKSFVYGKVLWEKRASGSVLIIELLARKNSQGECYECGVRCPTYDTQPSRDYEYVPLWGISAYFRYSPRRVGCKHHGIHVERVPWAEGKERMTKSYQGFLARWAKRLSWKETATAFRTSWESVHRAVKWVVDYGLANRDWDGVEQIGIDEIAVFKRHRYLTCVYQLDKHRRRLLWCGKDRKIKTLLRFFREFGKERCVALWTGNPFSLTLTLYVA